MEQSINMPKPPKNKCDKKVLDFMRKNRMKSKIENRINENDKNYKSSNESIKLLNISNSLDNINLYNSSINNDMLLTFNINKEINS